MAKNKSQDALFPIFVIDGAIKPITISGTQKDIIWPRIYLSVTTTFKTALTNDEPSA